MHVPGLTVLAAVLAGGMLACAPAGEEHEVRLVIENHRFQPAEVTVPAGKRIRLVVENRDDSAEEFESHTMKAEKVVGPKATITVSVGPLDAGSYEFFGEFNPQTATGTLIAQ
jgi:plastocyanin